VVDEAGPVVLMTVGLIEGVYVLLGVGCIDEVLGIAEVLGWVTLELEGQLVSEGLLTNVVDEAGPVVIMVVGLIEGAYVVLGEGCEGCIDEVLGWV